MKVAGRQISVLVAASSFAIIALLGASVGYFSQGPLQKSTGTKPTLSTTINVDGPDAQRITLTSHEGTSTKWGSLSGRHRLVFFGYTFCPEICPVSLLNIGEALDILQEKGIEPDPIFVTVDPQRDTPELLKEYLSAFREGFLGLSGDDDQIKELSEVFKAYYERSDQSDTSEYYLMDHTSYIYLVAPDGTLLEYYPESTEPPELAQKILAKL
ncbi:protein senC [Pseudovibrio japonicus]|uniref:Protein senC n=1 Tax=Pseudovibrio japonicus TaxID=366534 RepID=A0ABQ3EJ35_9HYPH|nr:SCO family protein [Pseudovibrio japonicus]GHB42217.1 protein senC [Pseudovibrio japonicus]